MLRLTVSLSVCSCLLFSVVTSRYRSARYAYGWSRFLIPGGVVLDERWAWIGCFVAAGLVILLGIWLILLHRLQRRLQLVFKRVTAGLLAREVKLTEATKLGSLADSIQEMIQSIELRIKRLEAERSGLEDRSRLLETVFSGMVEGVIAVDPSERILFANDSALPLLDVKEESLVGRLMLEVTRNKSVHDVVRESLAGSDEAPVELEIGRSAKRLRIVARRLPGEPCPGVVLIFHDVTELRRLEAIRSEFVSNVSHELKTPLSTISAYAETLLDGALNDTANNRRFVERIDEQSRRLHELIVDLLRLAHIEAREAAIETEPVCVSAAVDRCIEDHRALIDPQHLQLKCETPPDDVHVLATEEGLRTILNNLVANAIKFTSKGSIRLIWRVVHGQVCISVEDTGMGIAEKNQSRVFERFFRGDSARSRDAGGTGLGLSIVKHLAQSFNGHVELTSKLGVGSRFTVVLPPA